MAVTEETKKKNPSNEMTCQLKLDTSAKGWQKTISKVLKTIEGVSYSIDIQNGNVTVTGTIEPQALLTLLAKSGKHAELVRVDSGVLREQRLKKQQQQQQQQQQNYGQSSYGYINSYYPQQYGYYNHSGAGYPYGTTPDYYRTYSQLYPNYYQQQPVRPPTPPLGFPQPPPPMEIHPFYDPETQCTIM